MSLPSALIRLGPLFVKLGQYLALRPDVLPQEVCDELLTLVDEVPPFPWSEARAILVRELGGEPEALFAHFPRQPAASGSLAQVYVARLASGEAVAVKVLRPGIEERAEKDLRRLRWLLRAVPLSGVSPAELLAEIRRSLYEEIDLERELRHLTRLRDARGAQSAPVRLPRPFPQLSARRVVTVEYLEGVPFSELLRNVRQGQPERPAAMGLDRDQLAENLLAAVFEQIFRWRVFHADTHPGNLIALPGNAIGFVDFGLVDRLDPTVHAGLSRYLTALFRGDAERIEQGLREVLLATDESDADGLSDAIRAAVRQWRSGEAAPEPGQRSALATLMIRALDAARRHGFGVPPSALAMYRSLLTAEMVARQLAPDADLRGVARRFLADLALSEALEALYPDQVKAALIDLAALVRDLPGDLQQIVSSLAEGRLPVKLQTSESRQDRRLGAIKARLLTTAIVSVGVAVLLVGLGDTPLPGGLTLAPLLWTVMAALYVGIFILWRRLP